MLRQVGCYRPFRLVFDISIINDSLKWVTSFSEKIEERYAGGY